MPFQAEIVPGSQSRGDHICPSLVRDRRLPESPAQPLPSLKLRRLWRDWSFSRIANRSVPRPAAGAGCPSSVASRAVPARPAIRQNREEADRASPLTPVPASVHRRQPIIQTAASSHPNPNPRSSRGVRSTECRSRRSFFPLRHRPRRRCAGRACCQSTRRSE